MPTVKHTIGARQVHGQYGLGPAVAPEAGSTPAHVRQARNSATPSGQQQSQYGSQRGERQKASSVSWLTGCGPCMGVAGVPGQVGLGLLRAGSCLIALVVGEALELGAETDVGGTEKEA